MTLHYMYQGVTYARPRSAGALRATMGDGELMPHPRDVLRCRIERRTYECMSRAGRPRLEHSWDKDLVCVFCDREMD